MRLEEGGEGQVAEELLIGGHRGRSVGIREGAPGLLAATASNVVERR